MENTTSPPITFTNSANQGQIDSPGFYGTDEYKTITVVLLIIVISIGFLGNLGVYGAISQSQKHKRNSRNYLLMNIAVADLLVAAVIAPLRFVEMYHGWPLGKFLCQSLAAFQDVIVCVSVITHTVIALERYRSIVQPFKQKLSIRRTKQAIAIIWLSCYIAIGLPMALVLTEEVEDGVNRCKAVWSSLVRQLFEVYLVIVFIVSPLLIQTYTYSCVVKVVNRELLAATSSSNPDTRLTKAALSKARVVKMLVLLVGAFQLCSIPRIVTMLMSEFGGEALSSDRNFQYTITITVIIYYLKHVINPFIIFATSAEFRESCSYYCCCYCLSCQLRDDD